MSARSTRPPGNTSRLGMKRCFAPRIPISMCGSLFSWRSTIRLAACLNRTVRRGASKAPPWATSSGKVETFRLQVGAKTETFWHGKLARDILAPADTIAGRVDIVVLLAAGGNRITRVPALVIGGDFGFQRAVVIALPVNHHRRRQPHRHRAAKHRPADAKPG